MTLNALTRSLAGSVAAIGLSANISAAESSWPDLPVIVCVKFCKAGRPVRPAKRLREECFSCAP
jgi:hypothetical protein